MIFTIVLLLSIISNISCKYFHYDGDIKSFDDLKQEHYGEIKYFDGDTFESPFKNERAIEFSQVYDHNYHGRYHSEVGLSNAYKPGETVYYGFAFKIPNEWQFTDDTMTILQFIADFNGWEENGLKGKSWSPSTKIWIKGNQLFARIRQGSVLEEDNEWFNIADVSKDTWHSVVFGVKWSETTDGWFKLWYDKKLAINRRDVPTTMKTDNRPFDLRLGLYATDWYNHGGVMKGHQAKKTIYIDKIAMGDWLDVVDPYLWEDPYHKNKKQLRQKK